MIKTKSGARKIEGTDNWREIFDDHNYTVDALDQLADDMAIIVNGNKTAYASGAAVGQYVLLRNSTITDRADGMYKAAKAIPYNTTIDKTYLTAVSGGAINSLSDHIEGIPTITSSGSGLQKRFTYTFPSGLKIETGKFRTHTVADTSRYVSENYTGYLPTVTNAWFTPLQFSTSLPNYISFYFDGDTASSLRVGCSNTNDWVEVRWWQIYV